MELRVSRAILLLILGVGCSIPRPDAVPPEFIVGSVSMASVVREEIEQQRTSFVLNPKDDLEAWVRARYFFQTYVGGHPIISDYEFFSDVSAGDPLVFQVLRRKTTQGAVYDVSCSAVEESQLQMAQLNAKNLARFLENGMLAVELLPGGNGAPAS